MIAETLAPWHLTRTLARLWCTTITDVTLDGGNIRSTANGGISYMRPRQDIYLQGKADPLPSITVMGPMNVEEGSIWVWAEHKEHGNSGTQFAVLQQQLLRDKMKPEELEATLKVFRNARTDDPEDDSADYIGSNNKTNSYLYVNTCKSLVIPRLSWLLLRILEWSIMPKSTQESK